jgi:hypothetical protein
VSPWMYHVCCALCCPSPLTRAVLLLLAAAWPPAPLPLAAAAGPSSLAKGHRASLTWSGVTQFLALQAVTQG